MRRSLLGEWRSIVTNRKLLIPVIAIFFIPVMYAGMFLWAFWDPYSHLDRLPVAIVNQDQGAHLDGENVNLGADLVTNLKKDQSFKFKLMSQQEADQAFQSNHSYMTIEIPKNFSENAATLTDLHPQKMVLKYIPNQGYNFIAGQIDKNSMNVIKQSIQQEVTKTYSKSIFGKLQESAKGFKEASLGAKKVDHGVVKLNDGAEQLTSHLKSFASHTTDLKDGLASSKTGSTQVLSGVQGLQSGLGALKTAEGQLLDGVQAGKTGTDQFVSGLSQESAGLDTVDSKMKDLRQGMKTEEAGLNQLNQSMPELQTGTKSLAEGATQLNQGLDQMETQLIDQMNQSQKEQFANLLPYLQQSMTQDQLAALKANMEQKQTQMVEQIQHSFDQLKTGSDGLVSGSNQMSDTVKKDLSPNVSALNQGMQQLTQGQSQLGDAIHKLASSAHDLKTGATNLQTGESKLLAGTTTFNDKLNEAYTGADQLVNGTTRLNQGLSQLSSGAAQLNAGSVQLVSGSDELLSGTQSLQTGSHTLFKNLNTAATQSNGLQPNSSTYNMMASPVQLKSETVHSVPNYGTGFAAYFLSLGLFVGALLISVIYPFVAPAIRPRNGWAWYSSKFFTLVSIGIIQALIAVAILLIGLGLKVESVPLFILTALITSFTFITLIQLLVSAFADPGRYLAVMLLILQLTTCGGTFPLELLPTKLQALHTFLPMNYSLIAFKSVISTGDYGQLWHCLLILLSYAIAFILLAIVVFQFKYVKTYSQLEEDVA